jgi:hypothetical protein
VAPHILSIAAESGVKAWSSKDNFLYICIS